MCSVGPTALLTAVTSNNTTLRHNGHTITQYRPNTVILQYVGLRFSSRERMSENRWTDEIFCLQQYIKHDLKFRIKFLRIFIFHEIVPLGQHCKWWLRVNTILV